MGRAAFRGAIVALLLGAPSFAHAICGAPPPVTVSLRRGVAAPLNARPVLVAPAAWRGSKPLVLATAPRVGQPRTRVELRERAWTSAGHERIELTPAKELSPATVYQLESSTGDVFGVFTTGAKPDTTPPTWAGLSSGRLWQPPQRGRPVQIPGECGDDLITLEASAAATDDQTPAADLRYALWAGDAKAPLDYKAPPRTWIRADFEEQKRLTPASRGTPRFYLLFGSTEAELMDFELPKTRPLKIGIKAIDLAGNESAASELSLP